MGGYGWVGKPRPYDLSFVDGLRGLCVVGIVYCLNQDFQDYRIFRIGRGLYTFRTVGAWNVGFRSSTQPTRSVAIRRVLLQLGVA